MTDPIQTNPIQPVQPASGGNSQQSQPEIEGPSFAETLQQNIRFSNHAQKRLEKRNISLSDDGISRLTQAVEKAEKRGGRESLVLVDDMAFIVNVQERLVVTALDRNKAGDGVFTQIDSVVFAEDNDNDNAVSASQDAGNQVEKP